MDIKNNIFQNINSNIISQLKTLKFIYQHDPKNPKISDISQELCQIATENGHISEAKEYIKTAYHNCLDEEKKYILKKRLEIYEITADIYRQPESEFELIGKTLLEAKFAPVTKLVPMLMKICGFLDTNFYIRYETHKNLFPINESFLDTYRSATEFEI